MLWALLGCTPDPTDPGIAAERVRQVSQMLPRLREHGIQDVGYGWTGVCAEDIGAVTCNPDKAQYVDWVWGIVGINITSSGVTATPVGACRDSMCFSYIVYYLPTDPQPTEDDAAPSPLPGGWLIIDED